MSENAENGDNIEEDTEPKSYNLLELLDLEKELEEESAAVLGGSDEKCCTYNTGYIKRQALYSCLTCCPDAKEDLSKAAGVCLACSYKCHENHEFIELYTKRNFKCDCPTKKIPNSKCSFISNSNEGTSASFSDAENTKFDSNAANQYDHNFSGNYCICKRPYPDPDDPIVDEMIQCVVCEDWFHTRHLKCEIVPKINEYSEMICGECVEKNDFLKSYFGMAINKITKAENGHESTSSLDISVNEVDEVKNEQENSEVVKGSDVPEKTSESTTSDCANVEKKEENYETPCKKSKLEEKENVVEAAGDCIKPKKVLDEYKEGAIFWPDDWRKLLCTCMDCKKIYTENKVCFLLDSEDTISVYEEKGLKKYNSYYDLAVNAMSSLGHTQKIDLITGFNHLKDKLRDFFDSFAKEKKVVTETDVKDFFQKLNAERSEVLKQQQYFCR